jgi:hypothetical protein
MAKKNKDGTKPEPAQIPELRGMTRVHLCSVGKDYDVYLEVCHHAPVDNKKAFCIHGSRYVLARGGEDVGVFTFPNRLEQYIADNP